MTLESDIERTCKHHAWMVHGVESIKLDVTCNRGVPDRLFILPGGRTWWVEFKRPGAKPTPLQTVRHRRLRALGHVVDVCDDFVAFRDRLEEVIRAEG